MMVLLIVFAVCLVLMGASLFGGDDVGFMVAFTGAVLFGVATLVGAIMMWAGAPGVAW
jgi:hypothetical protein